MIGHFRIPVAQSGRGGRQVRRGLAGLWLLALLLSAASARADLSVLATLDGASGYEGPVREYVSKAVGGKQEVDNTGSLTATFGTGAPHTLLIAGLDEPGYVVSAITADGYLRVHRLFATPPHHDFESFFLAQPVHVRTAADKAVNGVVAALSVHLQADRATTVPRTDHPEQMYIDIGARSEREARAAGVDLLDPITLEKSYTELGKSGVSAPWISGRAGAEALIELGGVMAEHPPAGTVTLAFVSQQYNGNVGLARVLARVPADRIVWLKPGGGAKPAVAPVADGAPQMADQIAALAAKRKLDLDRDPAARLGVPAFASEQIWKQPERAASLTLGVENAGTPVEVVSRLVRGLLEELVGLNIEVGVGGSFGSGAVEPPVLEQLVGVGGVSGHEAPVRQVIQKLLPDWAKRASRVDDKGNLIVALGDKPERLFLSHMDELGFEVSEVESNGKLWAVARGNGNLDYYEWRSGTVHTETGSLPAILLGSQGGGVSERLEVDIGATTAPEAEAMGVRTGSTVTVRKKLRPLLRTRVSARSLDDRAGCAVLVDLLRSLRPEQIRRPTWFAFTVDEETGLHGAEFLAESAHPKEVYPLDTFVSSDSPLENPRFADARLGEGFVVRAIDSSGMTPRDAVLRVAALAGRHNIPVQYGVTSGANDGSKFVAGGAVNIPLAWPLRYAHTPVEVADLADIEALGKILRALATEP